MPLTTTLPPLDRWKTAPSTDTLRSLYDASADQWHDNLHRLGQIRDYQLLFESQVVRDRLKTLDRTSRILDCGVGTGAFSAALLDSIEQPVHMSGLDISYPMLTHARHNLRHRCTTLDLQCGDIKQLPFADDSFDAVIFAHVLEHMADPVEALREMIRVLKPGAPLIGSVTRKGLGQVLLSLRWHNRGYASNHLDTCLQAAGLEAVKSFNYGSGWAKWMCLAAIGVKPRAEISFYLT